MTEVHLIYMALISLPIFIIASFSDLKTKRLDVRSFWFLKGLAYASFFANSVWILLALAVSFSILVVQFFVSRQKVAMIGSGDFPVFHVYNLITMLYSSNLYIFVAFFIVPLIFFGVWQWFFRDRSFVPPVTLSLVLFFYCMFFVF